MERSPDKKGKRFWGEKWWDVLHSGAAFYTPDHSHDYLLLLQGYKGMIPCRQCRHHFSQNLVKYPIEPYLENNKKLLLWTYIVHDSVNQAHNSHNPSEPPKASPPFSQIVEKYTSSPDRWMGSWRFVLHSAAASYTPSQAEDYIKLVKSYTGLIPSKVQRVKFDQTLERVPVETYLRSNQDLFFWTYIVCCVLASPNGSVPAYIDVKKYYYSGLGEECKSCER